MPESLQFEGGRFRKAQQILKPQQQKQSVPHKHSGNQSRRPCSRHDPNESYEQRDKESCAKTAPEPPGRMGASSYDGRHESARRTHLGTSTADRISAITESAVEPSRSASGFKIRRGRKNAGAGP